MRKNITYILINLTSIGLLLFVDNWNELYFGIIAIITVLFTMTRYLIDDINKLSTLDQKVDKLEADTREDLAKIVDSINSINNNLAIKDIEI